MALLKAKIGGFAPKYPVVMFARREIAKNKFAPRMILWTDPTRGVVIDGDLKELAAIAARVARHRVSTANMPENALDTANKSLKSKIEAMASGRVRTAEEINQELLSEAELLNLTLQERHSTSEPFTFVSKLSKLLNDLRAAQSLKTDEGKKRVDLLTRQLAGLLLTAAPTSDSNLHVDNQFLDWALSSLKLGKFKSEIMRKGSVFYAGKEYKTGIPLGREELRALGIPGYDEPIGEQLPPLPAIKQKLRAAALKRQQQSLLSKLRKKQTATVTAPGQAEQPAAQPVRAATRAEEPAAIQAIEEKTGIRRFVPSGIWPWVIGAGAGGLLGYWLRGRGPEEPEDQPSPVNVVFTPTIPYGHTVIVPQNLSALQAIQSQLGLQDQNQAEMMAKVLPGGFGPTTVIHGPPLPQLVMPTETKPERPSQPQVLAPYPEFEGD